MIKKIFLGLIIALSALSCDKDIEQFDNSTNYIYFDMPFVYDEYGRKTTERQDSLVYSFAMDDISVDKYEFKIPINTVGLAVDYDRHFKVIVDSASVSDEDWDQSCLANAVIPAGKLMDTLRIVVNRNKILKTQWKFIVFRIVENEHFAVGASELLQAKISFTDILQPPAWWNSWIRFFGEFSREKYAKWQEIYYLGADPNVEAYGPNTGKQLYWDQMPYYVMPSWYPSTFMFIGKLKQYFIDNEVYPDGDTSKPRITLP